MGRPDFWMPGIRLSGWSRVLLCLLMLAVRLRAETNAVAFSVSRLDVQGATLLSPSEVEEALRPAIGSAVSLATIQKACGELQVAYRRHGYLTVAVTLPPQKVSNGVVQIQVVEAPLRSITVVGNRWYSEGNVRRALPGLSTNSILNLAWFQPELDQANENRDRQISPTIIPGPYPGSSALQLKVVDRLPLHGHVEINDRSTPATPLLRLDTALQYNNLWQLDHQLGFQSTFSPQEMKEDDHQISTVFDEPKVASYSGFYRLPLWDHWGLSDPSKQPSTAFGYDPVLRTFVLPPSSGSPELIAYASHSSSETQTRYGPPTTISSNLLLEVFNQSIERELTGNDNLGSKILIPLPPFAGVSSTISFGVDYKYYNAWTYHTNLSTVNIYTTNGGDRVLFNSQSVTNQVISSVSVDYIPLSIGWSGRKTDSWGNSSFNLSQNLFLADLASSESRFQQVAGSTQAGGTYTTIQAGLSREQRIYEQWAVLARVSGQWASAPLIGNEQFALGGLSGVRGYHDGEDYGDAGWKLLLDLRPPAWHQEALEGAFGPLSTVFRFSGFLDYGERYLLDAPAGRESTQRMLGVGAGWLTNVGQGFEARLVVGIALLNGPLSSTGSVRAYFNVGYQF
jgi:hemolysin activation/secretion protein